MKIINKQKIKLILFLFLILNLILHTNIINIHASIIPINNDISKTQKEKILNLIDETDRNFKTFKKNFNKEFIIKLQKTTSKLKKSLSQVNCKEKNIKELEIYINNLKYFNQQLFEQK
ncbi:hypothetical protein [Candidatus Phytoplasma prunorum]|uniref:hypothetical protein n=1 Tax=Candidatus Phytoplasma prunorum TaxID=47565 RepID=UPI002FF1EA16